jgi:spore germination cell wall hydrolase CwlJ-like protein
MTKLKKTPVALGRHYSGKESEKAELIGNNKSHITGTVNKNSTTVGEFELFVAIVYGEANSCSEAAWRAVGHVIMNRIGNHEWSKLNTVTAILTQKYAFEAYHKTQFNIADKYLYDKTKDKKTDKLIDRMIEVLKPVYNKTDPDNTSGAILYFSPKAQKALGRDKPFWAASSKLIEAKVDGLEATDDFKFYKYKPKTKPKIKAAKSAKTKKK